MSLIEYTVNDEKIFLEDLYCVELNGNKHICTREKIGREGLEIIESHQIFTTTGVYLTATAHDTYSYTDIKTNEVVGTSYTDNMNVFSIYKYIKFDITNYKT